MNVSSSSVADLVVQFLDYINLNQENNGVNAT